MSASLPTSVEDRALRFLGQGATPEQTAQAVGVTPSAISQLLSREDFAAKVAEARFVNLSANNARDEKYASLEDKLLEKLEDLLPFMVKPMEVVAALTRINAATRRGASAPAQLHTQQTVLTLHIPTLAINNFTTNVHNQVIKAGAQELITIQSGNMQNLLASRKEKENVYEPGQLQSLPNGRETTKSGAES